MDPIVVSVNGAAEALNLGRTSIYALIKEGRLLTIKLGRRTLIKVDSIHALLSQGDKPQAQ
jgi:excisionase family DNA binding protein